MNIVVLGCVFYGILMGQFFYAGRTMSEYFFHIFWVPMAKM